MYKLTCNMKNPKAPIINEQANESGSLFVMMGGFVELLTEDYMMDTVSIDASTEPFKVVQHFDDGSTITLEKVQG